MTEPTPAQPHATPSRISRLTPTNSIAAYEQLLAAKETDLTRLQEEVGRLQAEVSYLRQQLWRTQTELTGARAVIAALSERIADQPPVLAKTG